MIRTKMRTYEYYTLVDGEADAYGQETLSAEPVGTVKMAVFVSSQSVQDHALYSNAEYVGLTLDNVTDEYIFKYGNELLKVLYVNPQGRCKQVFMSRMRKND